MRTAKAVPCVTSAPRLAREGRHKVTPSIIQRRQPPPPRCLPSAAELLSIRFGDAQLSPGGPCLQPGGSATQEVRPPRRVGGSRGPACRPCLARANRNSTGAVSNLKFSSSHIEKGKMKQLKLILIMYLVNNTNISTHNQYKNY